MDSIAILGIAAAIYLAPTIVAYNRQVPSIGSVAVINIFLGWTLIGWVVALAMAARSVPEAHLQALEARRQEEMRWRTEEQQRKHQELLAKLDERQRR